MTKSCRPAQISSNGASAKPKVTRSRMPRGSRSNQGARRLTGLAHPIKLEDVDKALA